MDDIYCVESITHDESNRTMTVGLSNLKLTPVTGTYTLVDDSAIPSPATTGGVSGGSAAGLVPLGGGNVSASQLYALAVAAGFTGNDAVMAVAVALAESSGNPNANNAGTNKNKTVDYGLWQINSCHLQDGGAIPSDPNLLYDPMTNARSAFQIWSRGGWGAWSTYPDAARTHLAEAQAAASGPPAQVPTGNAAFSAPGATSNNSSLVAAMNQWVGTPYVLGGQTPKKAVDCSGFTQAVYKANGISLPRTAQTQYNACTPVSTPQFGDLVFFQGTYDCPDKVTHVGIYVGNNQMVSAVEPQVKRETLSSQYWTSHLVGFGRPPGA
jgi:cell wall-associated NlpC family hydrolase